VHRRHEDDGHVARRAVFSREPRDLVAVHLGHLHVEQQHGELAPQELAEGLVARARADDVTVEARELGFQRDQVRVDVVDDQDRGAWFQTRVDARSGVVRAHGSPRWR